MFFSLLVPKTRMMTSRTTSQCQIENEPMYVLQVTTTDASRPGTSQHVHVQVIDLLPASGPLLSRRGNGRGALFSCQPRCEELHLPNSRVRAEVRRVEVVEVFPRHHQQVHRRGRMDVVQDDQVVVLVDLRLVFRR